MSFTGNDDLRTRAITVATATQPGTITPAQVGNLIRDLADTAVDYYTPEDYDAAGDGTTDDTTALLNMLTAAAGKRCVLKEDATYHFTYIAYEGDVWLEGNATLHSDSDTSSNLFQVSGASVLSTTLAANSYTNDRTLSLTSATGVAAGDLITVESTTRLWPSDDRGQLYEAVVLRIQAVSGTTVELESSVPLGFLSGDTVTVRRPATAVIRNVTFSRDAVNGSSKGIALIDCVHSRIENVKVADCTRYGIVLQRCYGSTVTGGRVDRASLAVSESLGYGVKTDACFKCVIRGVTTTECRRGVDVGGETIPDWFVDVEDCVVYCGGQAEDGTEFHPAGAVQSSGVGTHGGAFGCHFARNTIFNPYIGLQIRGRHITCENNLIVGDTYQPVYIQWAAACVFNNNRYDDNGNGDLATDDFLVTGGAPGGRPDYFIYTNQDYDWYTSLVLRGNVARNVNSGFMYVENPSGSFVRNIVFSGNFVGVDNATLATLLDTDNNTYGADIDDDGTSIIWTDAAAVRRIDLNPDTANASSPESSVNKIGDTYWVSIIDDEAVSLLAPRGNTGFQAVVHAWPSNANASPIFNGTLRNASATTVDLGGTTGFTVATAVLTGTDGTDGNTTISYVDGRVYIENRSNATILLCAKIL